MSCPAFLHVSLFSTGVGEGVTQETRDWDPHTIIRLPTYLSLCQEARTTYRRILQESARKLNTQGSQLGSCIEKARPYYEARRLAKEVQPPILDLRGPCTDPGPGFVLYMEWETDHFFSLLFSSLPFGSCLSFLFTLYFFYPSSSLFFTEIMWVHY